MGKWPHEAKKPEKISSISPSIQPPRQRTRDAIIHRPSEILQIYSKEVNENMPVGRKSAKPSLASRPAQIAPRSGSDVKLATNSRPDRIPTRGLTQSSTTGSHTELGDSTRLELGTLTRAR
ncbi:hypothetical protein U1Q18_032476 [Sarracenia purpurea var. burkii]